jgi:hypothetical protein
MPRTTDPPESEAQRRAMGAAAGGKSNLGIPPSVGKEMIEKDPGGKLPEKVKDEPAEHQEMAERIRAQSGGKDVEAPKPASGPMSTKGPYGTSEGLPATSEALKAQASAPDRAKDTAGRAMSLDEIKTNAKRIGRY